MGTLRIQQQSPVFNLMNPLASKFRATTLALSSATFRCFCATSSSPTLTATEQVKGKRSTRKSNKGGRVSSKASDAQLKENWLDSLTCPFPDKLLTPEAQGFDVSPSDSKSSWVIGIDPDVSGALALLKPDDDSTCSAQVFDSPIVKLLVGGRARRRLDAKSIVQLLKSFDCPPGTEPTWLYYPLPTLNIVFARIFMVEVHLTGGLSLWNGNRTEIDILWNLVLGVGFLRLPGTSAYLEQSIPFPQDGKQGWWSGGFAYGLWIGALVASGFNVVPVPSFVWKNEFKLSGNGSSKDSSREFASTLFPSMTSSLKRKKDHGRAEALLIAAYGKGLQTSNTPPHISEDLTTLT